MTLAVVGRRSARAPSTVATLETSAAAERFLIVDEGKVRVWSARDGAEVTELVSDGAWACDAKFSPDGSMIATGDSDGVVRIWAPVN